MLACPGCGADLKYDINQGKLVCDYCSTDYSPTDDRLKQKAAQEEEVINAKVFTCPQCGGEMYTTDIDATAYCSYCGASNILQSRLEGVENPILVTDEITLTPQKNCRGNRVGTDGINRRCFFISSEGKVTDLASTVSRDDAVGNER